MLLLIAIYAPSALGGGGGGAIGGEAPPPSTSDLAIYRGIDFVFNLGSMVSPSHPLWGWAIIILALILAGYAVRLIKGMDFDRIKFLVMVAIILVSFIYISNNPKFLGDTALREGITIDEKPTSGHIYEQKLYIVESFIFGLGNRISPSYPILGWACVILAIVVFCYIINHIKEKTPLKYFLIMLLLIPMATAYNACIDGDTKIDNLTYICYDAPSEKILNQKVSSAWNLIDTKASKIKIPEFSDRAVLYASFAVFLISYLNYRVVKGGVR